MTQAACTARTHSLRHHVQERESRSHARIYTTRVAMILAYGRVLGHHRYPVTQRQILNVVILSFAL